uniref:non-specific serine/threonine protein kinase n=1 Tax=Oryza rufipogon TaxID=4529 RepID=A0A0E0MQL4_ORYRU
MDFTNLLITVLLLLSPLKYKSDVATASDDEDFFKTCSSNRCSKHGPEIRYPFRLSTQSPSCGAPGMQLSCSGQDTILDHPVLGSCKVTMIYYRHVIMNAIPLVDFSPHCLLHKFISVNQSTAVYRPHTLKAASLVGCSRDSIDTNQYNSIVGPTSCLSLANNASQFWYLAYPYTYMFILPLGCTIVSKDIPMPYSYDKNGPNFDISIFTETAKRVISTVFANNVNMKVGVVALALKGIKHSASIIVCPRVTIIAATSSVGTFIVLSLIVATALYISLKSRYNEEIHLKVEMFLKTYGTSKPTRYTFSKVKKIARRFKDKLGHGAFGTVYKGELPNGVPVAVKMLENSVGEGQEFINEVATIGRIHHANIVRLLGFCSEGTRQALIYEFMPNESLEKYIFPHDPTIENQNEFYFPEWIYERVINGQDLVLNMETTQGEKETVRQLAIVAIHHANIVRLLGFCSDGTRWALIYEFMPNESLEKYIFQIDSNVSRQFLIPKKMLDISLGVARGMEYLHQGCNQRILHFDIKSCNILLDYSFNPKISDFGLAKLCARDQSIVTLTAARGTMGYIAPELYSRNFGAISYKSDVYSFGVLVLEMWNPKNRPSMTKVVNMLTGRLQNLQVPPKPFISSENHLAIVRDQDE